MTTLADIIAATRLGITQRLAESDLDAMELMAADHKPRGFRKALSANQERVAVIAELKQASPSKGLIRRNFNAAELARDLEAAGAAALSVLTDEEFFQGSPANLRAASENSALPCLRKDFIVDEFQILEARANRADAVLLIVAALSDDELRSLAERARKYDLDILCEVHDEEELGRALDAGCDLIGVNSRDLKTFKVDLDTAFRLADSLPPNVLSVAESGIESGADISRLRSAGYDAFLIGESLMRAEHPGRALRALLSDASEVLPTTNDQRPTTVL
jgi:indole-3-glycerol phosphate synthase